MTNPAPIPASVARKLDNQLPGYTCQNCGETIPQEDGPVCMYCNHDHRENEVKE